MAKAFFDEVESLGKSLIKEAKKPNAELSDRIAIFAHCVKWAAVSNKLEPDNDGNGWKIGNGIGGKGSADKKAKNPDTAPSSPNVPAPNPTTYTGYPTKLAESLREPGGSYSDDIMSDTIPARHSFPVIDGSIHTEPDGGEGAGNGTDSGSGNL